MTRVLFVGQRPETVDYSAHATRAPVPPAPRRPPSLRVIDGGRGAKRENQRDIRKTEKQEKMPRPGPAREAQVIDLTGGADGTRTRDPRRDRPSF